VAGQKAVSSAINYVNTVSYAGINSEELNRIAGHDVAVLSRIYDWCYDLMTSEQKTRLISKCEELAYQLEIGWPPENLSAISGFGAEGSLQNYLLTFAIAVADERPDIYNYVVGRIEDEYIPSRKVLYASGEGLQGTRYGTYRGQHDLTAALLLSTIGYGTDVYGEGLEDLVNWYIYARRPDGMLFVDGDDTNNAKTPGKYYTVGHMQNAFVIAARLFNNPYIKNEAKKATENFSLFEYGEGYLSPASFLAINRPELSGIEKNGYPLSKYFGYPNGNIIARTGWNHSPSVTDDTVVAFMKTGQVNISNHQHLDAGNFQLYYKGILAKDSFPRNQALLKVGRNMSVNRYDKPHLSVLL
jgi:heparin/heparan-sulfate lyase